MLVSDAGHTRVESGLLFSKQLQGGYDLSDTPPVHCLVLRWRSASDAGMHRCWRRPVWKVASKSSARCTCTVRYKTKVLILSWRRHKQWCNTHAPQMLISSHSHKQSLTSLFLTLLDDVMQRSLTRSLRSITLVHLHTTLVHAFSQVG